MADRCLGKCPWSVRRPMVLVSDYWVGNANYGVVAAFDPIFWLHRELIRKGLVIDDTDVYRLQCRPHLGSLASSSSRTRRQMDPQRNLPYSLDAEQTRNRNHGYQISTPLNSSLIDNTLTQYSKAFSPSEETPKPFGTPKK